jgi:glycosyltransferase involved in cell wall biosynthesis
MSRLAVVVIGRNEGDRLGRCLDSVLGFGVPVVYVDSGSTDGSVLRARDRGADVLQLDPSTPFSAGRARNEGLERAVARCPTLEFIQFVDGDCELVPGWLEVAARELDARPEVAAICGRIRERDRERSVYNRLCDLEWQAPAGEAKACGGNTMVRVVAFREAGGFLPALIAGEEPELCLRLRRRGWTILRRDEDMVWHDADMTSFVQWWRRCVRAGWGYAEAAAMHGAAPERHCVRDNLRILFWGAALPTGALLLAAPTAGLSLLPLAAAYPLLGMRIYARAVRGGMTPRDARLQALFIVLAKFPQVVGQAQFVALRALRRRRRVVDWRVAS